MATATQSPSKTNFVMEFLHDNPQGNVKAVNEAWTAAGMNGTVSKTIVDRTRAKLGLTGNLRPTTRAAAKREAAPNIPKKANTPGKSSFVKEFLNDHPAGTTREVNEAWTAAGFDGTISRTLVDKMRALLGLTGNLGAKPSKKSKATSSRTGKKRGRPRKETSAAFNGQPRGRKSDRTVALTDLEADIDRLIFKAMAMGDLIEIEDTLRRARRLLYGALTRG